MTQGMIRESIESRRLAFDCSRIPSSTSGLGRFALSSMACLDLLGIEHDVIAPKGVFGDRTIVEIPASLRSHATVGRLTPLKWMLYAQRGFPCNSSQPLFSAMQNVVPKSNNQIITIHDIRPAEHPDTLLQGFYWRHILKRSIRSVKAVITVSETSKRKISDLFGVPPSKVFVVHNGSLNSPTPTAASETGRTQRILCVGCNWRHKNIHELIANHHGWSPRYQLDIVMSKTPYCLELKALVDHYGLSNQVAFHHGITDSKLAELYSRTAALVYPSIDEGFGLPPLEAMAHRTPVITSDIPVFRELFGDAPFYVKLGDPSSWNDVFDQIGHEELRALHINRGEAVFRRYDLSNMAQGLRTVIQSVWPHLLSPGV